VTEERREASPVPASFAPIVSAVARDRSVTRGKMFGSSNVLTVSGKIFAMLVRGKLVVKLPKQRVDELVAAKAGTYFDPGHGRLMKQWISIPAGKVDWVETASEAHRFVMAGIVANRLDHQMADLIGSVAGDRRTADRAHGAFGESLQKELHQKSRASSRRGRSKSRS
jgi:hypothetical protein